MKFGRLFLVLFCLLFMGQALTQNFKGWSNGWDRERLGTADTVIYLNSVEKEVVFYLNMLRDNPKRFAEVYLVPMLKYFNGKKYREPGWEYYYTYHEGRDAVIECINELREQEKLSILYPSFELTLASIDHAVEQGELGLIGHQSQDGRNMAERIEKYTTKFMTMGEVISYGPDNAREIVCGLLIDDNVPDRGHRKLMLWDKITQLGVSIKQHKEYRNVCVVNFGSE